MYSRSAVLLLQLAIVLVAPLGCAVDRDPATSSVVGATGGGSGSDDDEYVGHQGRLLLGFKGADVRTFTLPPSVVAPHVIDEGQLVASGLEGRDFIGVPMIASASGASILMRIANVLEPAGGGKWKYALEQYVPVTGLWIPACAEPPQLLPAVEPVESPPLAMAMPGYWTRDGLYNVNAASVSFACSTGVVAKCDGWGYRADKDPPDITELGMATSVTGPDMLQACTRMFRADYCAQGIPNTLDGTPIRLDDIFQTPPPHPSYAFEAAWPGVAIADRSVSRPPAICLSKLRWSTLPLGGTCPLQVPDPRIDGKGTFCDDMLPKEMELRGARTYSWSAYLDAGLYTYTDPPTGTRLTTASLVPAKAGFPPEWLIPPPPGIGFPVAGQPRQFEATIFAATLPGGISETGLVTLVSYQCPDGDLVTTTSPPAGCAQIAEEGHVYLPFTAGRAPLRRWWLPSVKRSVTTPASPTTMIANGWHLAENLGAVIRAAIDVQVRWSAVSGATYSLAVQTRTGEWVQPCIDTPSIGSATSLVYRGVCTSALGRTIDHSDIAAVRITSTSTVGTQVVTRAYNGFDSDTYVDIPGGKPTALAVSWNDAGPGFTYAFDVRTATSDWIRCAADNLLANSLSHIHMASCPSAGTIVKLVNVMAVRVCATWNHDATTEVCGEAGYDGSSSRLAIDLPATM